MSVFYDLKHGFWSWGCEFYKDKPMLCAGRTFYDGYWYYLHIGPIYVCVDPIAEDQHDTGVEL